MGMVHLPKKSWFASLAGLKAQADGFLPAYLPGVTHAGAAGVAVEFLSGFGDPYHAFSAFMVFLTDGSQLQKPKIPVFIRQLVQIFSEGAELSVQALAGIYAEMASRSQSGGEDQQQNQCDFCCPFHSVLL